MNLYEINFLQSQIFKEFESEIFLSQNIENNDKIQTFNIRNTIINAIEIYFIKAKNKQCEISLKFEDSFPKYVMGNFLVFKQVI